MEKGTVYQFTDFIEDADTKSKMHMYYDIILGIVSDEGLLWNKYNTRLGTRFVSEISFGHITGGGHIGIPKCFKDVQNEITILIQELLIVASKTITDGSVLIPIQIFLCYYRNGKDVCPMHSHKCRQITLSIGSDRTMTVGKTKKMLNNGSIIYLHGEKHGILKEEETGNRLSFNLFFTTSNEKDSVQQANRQNV